MTISEVPPGTRPLLPCGRCRPATRRKPGRLGLTSATGLVVGSIVETRDLHGPAVLAGAGAMGIVVLGVIAVGAMLLAVLFGQLTRRVPS
jgi:APA family basic amino acid/polyamine antiporter